MISNYLYVIIAIWSSMFMPESDHVAKFMDYDSKFIATFTYWYSLTSIPAFSNKWAAAESRKYTRVSIQLLLSMRCVKRSLEVIFKIRRRMAKNYFHTFFFFWGGEGFSRKFNFSRGTFLRNASLILLRYQWRLIIQCNG